ncbi:MAG: PAS domain S-box protein [Saprospiraceae bacterium]|nr:PAS domain S-box protein [Saprospiraceae bacterium]
MTNNIQIIQDISLLYEISLSIGNSLDPVENCHNFLRTLISRKSLNFGSVWLRRKTDDKKPVCDLFFTHPHFREDVKNISCDHALLQELKTRPYLCLLSQEPNFKDFVHEKKVGKGAYAIFRLGDLGFLKLFASNRPEGFPDMEMAQLKQVVDKLKTSLDGCFAHIRLKEETESRLEAQKALEESENKLRRIIDSSLDAVVSSTAEGVTIEWNAQAEKMFGYSRQEVLGRQLRDLVIPERNRHLFQNALDDYQRTTDENIINKRYEIKCSRKNGTEFPAELSFTADTSSKNILFVGFLRDITAQKKAMQEIEQARIRMETLITNLQTGILLEDSNRRITLVNQPFCDIFSIPVEPKNLPGYDCSQAAEQSKHLFKYPDQFLASIETALKNKILIENEVFVMADGRIFERDFIPLFSGTKYEGHLWQYRDVTERQNAQRAILESEEKYRGVLENMTLGLLEVDLKGNIIRTNNAFCQMLGYHPNELLGQNIAHRLQPDAAKMILYHHLSVREKEESSVYELQMRKKDGTLIWGLVSGAPIKNSQGVIIGSISILFDLTERKKMETELANAKLTADRARLAERQFLAHMSHEIRTPINAVIGMAHLLDETQPDATQKEYINSLRFSADSLLGIIDNILDLSKIDASEIEFEKKPFDLDYLLKSLLLAFQYKIEKKDIQIFASVDPAIKNIVIGDPTRTNQILTNLLSNALKFTERGMISLTAKLIGNSHGKYDIEFKIRDTGIGIPEDKLETIFEYFKQADVQINRKFGGTGLGLTIVKQLVEMQGGSIRVESRLGHGSDFIVSLSFGDSGIPVNEQKIIFEIDHQNSRKLSKGLHLLVVEDNLMNQKLICKTIQTWESTFDVAINGLEALEKAATQRFDAILMDIHMPEVDGFEATLAIRKDRNNPNRDVPIIALTAAAMYDDKRRAIEVGMNDFLTKPVSPKVLKEHILLAIQECRNKNVTEIPDAGNPEVVAPIDLNYLIELSNGDLHFVETMIDAFLAEAPELLQNLNAAVIEENWNQIYQQVHKLKPSFVMMGMNNLHEIAVEVESVVRRNPVDADVVVNLVVQMTTTADTMLPMLEELKSEMALQL